MDGLPSGLTGLTQKLLLDHSNRKVELNTRCFLGSTALMLARKKGHKDVIKLLLDHSKKERISNSTTEVKIGVRVDHLPLKSHFPGTGIPENFPGFPGISREMSKMAIFTI